ncbi:MAG TPA: hypothetical protein VHZ78_02060 [Rhizomicrobium sp.]|jgi:hypothetical protein|nr:hypothetical protein [Rhizomicrobium sp.]
MTNMIAVLYDRRWAFLFLLLIGAIANSANAFAGYHLIGSAVPTAVQTTPVWLPWANGHVFGMLYVKQNFAIVYWIMLAGMVVLPLLLWYVARIVRRDIAAEPDDDGDDTAEEPPSLLRTNLIRLSYVLAASGALVLAAAMVYALWLEATGSAAPTAGMTYRVANRWGAAPFYSSAQAATILRTLWIAGFVPLFAAALMGSGADMIARLKAFFGRA